jgi:hypothetical protein
MTTRDSARVTGVFEGFSPPTELRFLVIRSRRDICYAASVHFLQIKAKRAGSRAAARRAPRH